jgi:D-2-hydroxyacid dehydrogenase (NADP+)
VLTGKTLCVVGLGTIGHRCAELGAALGMRVIGVRRSPRPTPPAEAVYAAKDLCQALGRADVVIIVLPGTAETAGLIGRAELAALPQGALLLNAGRGKTVDTDALVAALASGHLAGAGLDVVDPEPLPPEHPLWTMPNVLITPHTSGLHRTYTPEATAAFLDNLRRFLAGQELVGVVDKTLGY